MFRLIIIFCCCFALMTMTMAELTPEIINRCKQATAIVDTGQSICTAFCINKSGYFVTSSRWLAPLYTSKQSVKVVLYPGTPEQYITKAKVMRLDESLTLAIIKIDDDKEYTALEIGNPSKIAELTDTYILGNSYKGQVANNAYLPISFMIARVASLKQVDGMLQLFKVSPTLNHSFCGGPVLDESGTVIGIVANGTYGEYYNGNGTDTVISSLAMRKSFDVPEFSISYPQINVENQQRTTDFNINAAFAYPLDKSYDIALTLNAGTSAEKKYPVTKVTDNLYQAKIIPVPPLDKPAALGLKVQSENNFFSCIIQNRNISVNGKEIPLDTIAAIEGVPPVVRLRNGIEVNGKITGLDNVEVTMGELKTVMNLTNANSIEIIDAGTQIDSIKYKVAINQDDKLIKEINGIIPVYSQPVIDFINNQRTGIKPAVMNKPSMTIALPGIADEVIEGGCGRYLILSFLKQKKIVIFDVNKLKITNEILMPTDNFKIAATIDKVLVLLPNLFIIQRYNLNSSKLEMSVTLPNNEMVFQAICAGSCSAGPVLINGFDYESRSYKFHLMDLSTLTLIKLKNNVYIASSSSPIMNMSDNGRIFSAGDSCFGKWNNSDIERLQSPAYLTSCPDFDGTLFFGKDKEILSKASQYNRLPEFRLSSCIPAVGGVYFIEVKDKSLTFYLTSTMKKLVTISELDDITVPKDRYAQTFQFRQQIHYIADANLLIYLNSDKDKLFLRKLSIEDALAADGIDYLYVASLPKPSFIPGLKYQYQVKVKSRKGNVIFSLENPLPGLSLSKTGLLEWQVPADYAKKSEDILISISDDSKQTIFHNFKLSAE